MLTRLLFQTARYAPGVLLGAAALLAAVYTGLFLRLPPADPVDAGPTGEAPAAWPALSPPPDTAWAAFRAPAEGGPSGAGRLARRFRFAGTFFLTPDGAGDHEASRHAVLEDAQQGDQHLVGVGDRVGDVSVVAIRPHEVVLRQGDYEESLRRSYDTGPPASSAADTDPADVPWDQRIREETPFGKHLITDGPNEDRWIISREALLDYRETLLDNPERLANLFVSMRPDRIDGKIEGYRLQMQGEEAFYQGVGLREQDVVRKVNSMNMTRQERAEYFIREFVNDRLSAVVLDIERDGRPHKLIYYLR
jgi:type II secretory pathway component PulC